MKIKVTLEIEDDDNGCAALVSRTYSHQEGNASDGWCFGQTIAAALIGIKDVLSHHQREDLFRALESSLVDDDFVSEVENAES